MSYTLTDVDNVITCTGATGITYTSTNTTLLPVANITRGGTYPTCLVTISPVSNLYGTTTVQLSATDGSLTGTQSFGVTVNSVNDAPVGSNATLLTPLDTVYTF